MYGGQQIPRKSHAVRWRNQHTRNCSGSSSSVPPSRTCLGTLGFRLQELALLAGCSALLLLFFVWENGRGGDKTKSVIDSDGPTFYTNDDSRSIGSCPVFNQEPSKGHVTDLTVHIESFPVIRTAFRTRPLRGFGGRTKTPSEFVRISTVVSLSINCREPKRI